MQQKIIDYAKETCGVDKFLFGIDSTKTDVGGVLQRVQLAKQNQCGIALWTAYAQFKWPEIVKALNEGQPPASFVNQPKGTPQWYIDTLNKKTPPGPP
jgi:hypothetical protein